jgi:hypothetical protein
MVLALLAAPAMAQDTSHIVAGLWESAIQVNGVALGTMQMCMDGSPETMAANLRARSNRPRPSATCDKPVTTPVPGGRRTEISCTIDGRVSHDVIVTTGDMHTHMHAEATMTAEGAPEVRNVIDLHRTGDCPAGMKPGDTKANMDSNAMANIAQAFAKKPPAPTPAQ